MLVEIIIVNGFHKSQLPSIQQQDTFVTEFVKSGLIHASDFPTLAGHNFICKQAIRLQFSLILVQ